MMNDGYAEHIVKAKTPGKIMAGVIIGIVLIFLGVVAFFVSRWGLTIILIGAVVFGIFFSRKDTEYEYIMVNDDVDISRIVAKKSRKKVYGFSNGDVKFIAKDGSIFLDNELRQDSSINTRDFSAADGGEENTYVFVLNRDGKTEFVRLELSGKALEHVGVFFKGKYREQQ